MEKPEFLCQYLPMHIHTMFIVYLGTWTDIKNMLVYLYGNVIANSWFLNWLNEPVKVQGYTLVFYLG